MIIGRRKCEKEKKSEKEIRKIEMHISYYDVESY